MADRRLEWFNHPMERWLTRFISDHGGAAGTVHLWDGEALVLAASVNIPPPVVQKIQRIPPGKGMAGLAWSRRAPVQTCNLQTDQSGDVQPGARAVSANAAVALPVFDDNQAVRAVAGIAFREERALEEAEIQSLSAAAATLPPGLA